MRWLVFVLAVFLSGCIAHYQGRYEGPPPMQSTSMAQANSMVGVQQPVAYKVGFMAGCDSGRVSAGSNSFIFKKDVERFGKDDLYQQGWNDGFSRCSSGEGIAAGSTSVSTYYGWGYYPWTYYSGYYSPYYNYSPYYSPGYSIWLGNYGHHDHYSYSGRHYYSPWYYGGHSKHKGSRGLAPYIGKQSGGGHSSAPYIGKQSGGGHSSGPYIGKHRGGGHKGSYKGGSHKSRGGGGHKGGGNKGLGNWIR